jgi:hypothetical protein
MTKPQLDANPDCSRFKDLDILIRLKIMESFGVPVSFLGNQPNYSSARLDSWDWWSTLPIPKLNVSES